MNAVVPTLNESLTRHASAQEIPLGTAAWQMGPRGLLSVHKPGDFWIGRYKDGSEIWGCADNRHALICSNTRGGKGISSVVPNLITWPGSVVVIDPKGENAIVTARRRAGGSEYADGLGQDVCILDPFNAVTTPWDDFKDLKHAFNPLAEISAAREESVDLASRIADALIISESADPFFDDAAKGLLKTIILHVATSPDFTDAERNLITVRRCIMAGDYKARKLAELNTRAKKPAPSSHALLATAMMRNPAFGGVIADGGVRLRDLGESPRTLTSVVQVAATNTDFIDSPGMKRVLASSSITLGDLKRNRMGMSLFITLPQRYMETHYRWLRMMTTLIIGEMEQVKTPPASGYPVMMMLDEFPALKRMRVIEHAAAQIAGFGVKLVFVVQTLAQLKDIYKDNWETLLANAGIKLFYSNDDQFTRKYVSDLMGECEVSRVVQSHALSKAQSYSHSESKTDGSSRGMSRSHGNSMNLSNGGNLSDSVNVGHSDGLSFSEGVSDSHGESASRTATMSESLQKRPLATPDEVGRLFSNDDTREALLLVSGAQPMRFTRTPYYRESSLAGLFDPHPSHPLPLKRREVTERRAQEYRSAVLRQEVARRQAGEVARLARKQERERRLNAHRAAEAERERAAKQKLAQEAYHSEMTALFTRQTRDNNMGTLFTWVVAVGLILPFAIAYLK